MSLAAKHGVPKLGLRRTGAVLRVVGQHLWPKGETGLRCRVVVAMVLLIVAKVTNVYVPVLYKHAVDALGEPTAQAVDRKSTRLNSSHATLSRMPSSA